MVKFIKDPESPCKEVIFSRICVQLHYAFLPGNSATSNSSPWKECGDFLRRRVGERHQHEIESIKTKGIRCQERRSRRHYFFVYLSAAARCEGRDREWAAEGPESTADGPSDKASCLSNLSPPTGVRGVPRRSGCCSSPATWQTGSPRLLFPHDRLKAFKYGGSGRRATSSLCDDSTIMNHGSR